MSDTKLSGLYVEVLTKGVDRVEADLKKVKDAVKTATDKPIMLKLATTELYEEAMAFSKQLQSALDNTPLSLKLGLIRDRDQALAQIKKDLADLPQEHRVRIINEKIDVVNAQIRTLKKSLEETPNDKTINLQLKYARDMRRGLTGQLSGGSPTEEATPSPAVVSKEATPSPAVVSKATEGMKQLSDTLSKIGTIAAASFAAGTAALTKLVSAADPVFFAQLQGTIAAISVQLGSVFLPILDSVKAALDSFLGALRSLSDEQKDQIATVTKVVGGMLLAAAIIPKLISAFSLLTSAVKVFGIVTTIATGGILPLVGVIVGGLAAFGLFASATEEGSGALSGFYESVRPLIDALVTLGKALMSAFQPLVTSLMEIGKVVLDGIVRVVSSLMGLVTPLVGVFRVIVSVISKVLDSVMPVIEQAISVIVEVFNSLVPPITAIIETVTTVIESLIPPVMFVVNAIVGYLKLLISGFQVAMKFVMPIINGIAEGFQLLGDTVSVITDMITDALSALFGGFGDFGEGVGGIFTFLGNAAETLGNVVKTVFGMIQSYIQGIIKMYIYLGALIASIASGNITGAAKAASDAVANYEARMEGKKREREEKRNATAEESTKTPGRHAPTATPKVELTGFAELWRKAMTAGLETPEQKAAQERGRLQKESLDEEKKHTRLLEQIAEQDSSNGIFVR